jgi:hypothetical protein
VFQYAQADKSRQQQRNRNRPAVKRKTRWFLVCCFCLSCSTLICHLLTLHGPSFCFSASFATKEKTHSRSGEWVSESPKTILFPLEYHSPDVPNMGHEQHELFVHIGIWRKMIIAKK